MIEHAIKHIAGQLNQHLRRRFRLTEDVVVTSDLTGPDGRISPQVNDKIIICLVNVEQDTIGQQMPRRLTERQRVQSTQPLSLNLYLMVACARSEYGEALKFLSAAIDYFHRQPVFDHASNPALDPGIERLSLEIENLEIRELSDLWSVIGGKYLPSVLYKVRMIMIDSGDFMHDVPPVTEPRSTVARPGASGQLDSRRDNEES